MGIGFTVIQLCTKTTLSTHRVSNTKFLRFVGVKTHTVDPIAMKLDSHLSYVKRKGQEEIECESDSRLSRDE